MLNSSQEIVQLNSELAEQHECCEGLENESNKLSLCLGVKPSDPQFYDIRSCLQKVVSRLYTSELLPRDPHLSPKKHKCTEKLQLLKR